MRGRASKNFALSRDLSTLLPLTVAQPLLRRTSQDFTFVAARRVLSVTEHVCEYTLKLLPSRSWTDQWQQILYWRTQQGSYNVESWEAWWCRQDFVCDIATKNLGFIIHYGVPRSLEDYFQESSRAIISTESLGCARLSGEDSCCFDPQEDVVLWQQYTCIISIKNVGARIIIQNLVYMVGD